MKRRSIVDLVLSQHKQEVVDKYVYEVIERKKPVKPVEDIKLKPTKITPAKNEKQLLKIMNELQDKHFLVLFHIVGKKVSWCEGHYKFVTLKECPIRTFIGNLSKPIKEKSGEKYFYMTHQIDSLPV